MHEIIGSIIARSEHDLQQRVGKIKEAVDGIQLDVMDGVFVEHQSLDFELPDHICENCFIEAHLMMYSPMKWIKRYRNFCDMFIVHRETVDNEVLDEIIEYVRDHNKQIGIALSPDTPIETIMKYVKSVDVILVLTVYPGKYGAEFVDKTLEKIKLLRGQSEIAIEVDGHIDEQTLPKVREAGVTRFCFGSHLQYSSNVKAYVHKLRLL